MKVDMLSAIGYSMSEHDSIKLYENLFRNNYHSAQMAPDSFDFEKQFVKASSRVPQNP